MISFQNPPDLILYTGARDSKKAGAAPPKGIITPGAVKYLDFRNKQGVFTGPDMGSARASASHFTLQRNQALQTKVDGDGEQVLFVWRGAIKVHDGRQAYTAGERDTVFINGQVDLQVIGDSDSPTEIIRIEAPPSALE